MKLDRLLLLSGNDIPFPMAQVTIHHPTIKEIAWIGEENFFSGYQTLNISKNLLSEVDKVDLDKLTNFDILIAILGEHNAVMQKNRACVKMVLALLFPQYQISIKRDAIELQLEDSDEKHHLTKDNFDEFQSVIKQLFSLEESDSVQTEFNPEGEMSRRIAEKLKKRQQKLAELKHTDAETVDIIGRYSSILAIGSNLSLTDVLNYTLYQLLDQVKRLALKTDYEIYIQAKMAGAKDLKDPEDWMKDIHSQN